jgi:hypothetical protein
LIEETFVEGNFPHSTATDKTFISKVTTSQPIRIKHDKKKTLSKTGNLKGYFQERKTIPGFLLGEKTEGVK